LRYQTDRSTFDSELEISYPKYQGCFDTSSLVNVIGFHVSDALTIDECSQEGISLGFKYVGLKYKDNEKYCYAGNRINPSNRLDDSECS
jgi:hypothetical protein